MPGREVVVRSELEDGVECIEIMMGPSRFPASAQYPECPAGLYNVGATYPGSHGYAVFSAQFTNHYRAEGRSTSCCYSFCQTVPGISFE